MTEYPEQGSTFSRAGRHVAPRETGRFAKGMLQTLPLLLAGSMAMSLNLTGPIESTTQKRADKSKDSSAELRKAVRQALAQQSPAAVDAAPATATTAAAPSTYRVAAGDTVSGIAARYGLATASVLALNGLGWKSIIFPGQVLKLTNGAVASTPKPAPAPTPKATSRYTIKSGDTVSSIAARFKVSTQSVLSANGLGWSSIIYPGQTLAIPGQPAPKAQTPTPPAPPAAPVTPPAPEAEAPKPPVVTPAPVTPPAQKDYVIKSGDTVSSIAARFGLSVQALLDANGLGWSSIIYAGRTLVVPGAGSGPASVPVVTPLTAEMAENARIILQVGRSLGVPDYGLVIALAAAAQESTLRNLDYGDRDSLGLFQQRPSTGWGTPAQVTDPVYSSKLFFGGPSNPNKGNTAGLLDIKDWQSMTVTQAAQAVQRSAYPDAYAKWEISARAWLSQLG